LVDIWFIVLEYVSERTLVDLVKQNSFLSEEVVKYFFEQMIDTLLYINSKGIAHRDIKLENMLVTADYVLKFADFGFASFSKDETVQRGTPIYIAPEIILNQPYDPEKTDVFSTGVVLFAMSTGKFPFDWAHHSDKRYLLFINKNYDAFWSEIS
jgi:serine/threonine protein kinase